jgi:Heterokaryon incompatibility protein (HET)
MRQIYEQAEQVVVWLGEPGDGDRVAMKSFDTQFRGVVGNIFRAWSVAGKLDVRRTYRDRVNESTTMGGTDMQFGEVCQLLDRPLWRRVWIVQDITLARRAVVVCGPEEVTWDSMRKALGSDGVYNFRIQQDSERNCRGVFFISRHGALYLGRFKDDLAIWRLEQQLIRTSLQVLKVWVY